MTVYQNCLNSSAPLNKMAARAKNRKTFKRLFLLNQCIDFEIIVQELSLGDLYRVRTDLEKSLKMTLVLENSWNCKKVHFVLELSLNFEKKLLDNHKMSLKMIETVFFDAVRNKNQENCKIGKRKRSAVPYSAVVPP